MSSKLFYAPTQQDIDNSVVTAFRLYVNAHYNLELKDAWQLHAFSVDRPNDFYTAVAQFANLIIDYDPVKPLFDHTRPMTETRHLINGNLNWAENQLLAHIHRRSPTQKAVVACNEAGFDVTLTYEDLYQQTRKAAHALRKLGVKAGDRVAAFAPNNAEAVVMVLATAAIGAVWSCCSAEFGVNACLERLDQIEPTVLLTTDRYRYGGKQHEIFDKLEKIVAQLSQKKLRTVVIVGQLSRSRDPQKALPTWSAGRVSYAGWNDFLRAGEDAPAEIEFNRGSAMQPLWILFSSGTTGKPKAIVHTHGGMLLSSVAAQSLHIDARPTDVYLQFTTLSWMMWNYQISHLATGSTIVVFDGSPLQPHGALWDIVERQRVTILNISPRYLQVLLLAGYKPKERHDVSSLRSIGSAGAPLAPELYDFMFRDIKHGIYVNNSSGGTDVCHILVGGSRTLPQYYGEIQMPAYGCRMAAYSDDGVPVSPGEEGHLVLTQPIPNQPIYFLNDEGDKRYRSTYFETFPNTTVWNQSDWATFSPKTGGVTILGRSDGVLNPQGVRFGSAELYEIVEKIAGIDDCLAVGQKLASRDERVVLFIKTPNNVPLTDALVKQVKDAIRAGLSTRHVPSVILQTPELPYTNNLKRCEVAVKKVINGTPIEKVNRSAMVNPQSLEWYVNRPELSLSTKRDAKL